MKPASCSKAPAGATASRMAARKLGDSLAGQRTRRDGVVGGNRLPRQVALVAGHQMRGPGTRRGRSAPGRRLRAAARDPPPPASDRHRPWPGKLRSIPSVSTSSAPSRMPAVSKSFTGMPPMDAVSETRSRVVPGMSVTMARSCSSRRLKRLLLPTLGRPTMASVRPPRHQRAVLEAGGQAGDAIRNRARGGAESRRRARR